MPNTYFIKGTITIQVASNAAPRIHITPCAGFLTPDKTPKGIAFPGPSNSSGNAKLIDLTDGRKEYKANNIKEKYLSGLLAIADQKKPIHLKLKGANSSTLRVVGFEYPAP